MYLQKLVLNAEGQHGDTVAYNESYENTIVQYHQTLAAFHNAPDVRKAVVQILDDNGRAIPKFSETVIHTPEPAGDDDLTDRGEI